MASITVANSGSIEDLQELTLYLGKQTAVSDMVELIITRDGGKKTSVDVTTTAKT